MNTKRIFMVSGAALLALTATASAGPMNALPSSEIVAAPLMKTEPVAYRYQRHYRHYGSRHHRYYYGYNNWNPGAAVAGTAAGLLSLPFAAATGGWPGYYGGPNYYYGGSYSPYYYGGSYSPYYYGGSYSPYYGQNGYRNRGHYAGYGGGIHTGRSVGYGYRHR